MDAQGQQERKWVFGVGDTIIYMGIGLVAFLGLSVSDPDLVHQVGLFHYAILNQ